MIASLSTYLALNERRLPARAAKMTAVDMRDADMVFWIGFCDEKMACAMSSWPSSYREEDITAFLPTCAGPYVSRPDRRSGRIQLKRPVMDDRANICNLFSGWDRRTCTLFIRCNIATLVHLDSFAFELTADGPLGRARSFSSKLQSCYRACTP